MKAVALPEAAKIVMGQSPPSSSYNTVGDGLPFFQGKADFGDLYPTVRMYCAAPNKIAKVGDILISVRAPVGPTNICPEKACIGRGLAAIRSLADTDSKYLLYFLRFYEPRLARSGKGSTFSAVSRSDLEEIQIPLPPLDEQQRIAAILAKADRLRRLRRFAGALSGTYLQSVFLKMFGDGKKARRVTIKELIRRKAILDMHDGNHGETHPRSSDFVPQGIPFLTAKNVIDGQVLLDSAPYISLEKASELRIGWIKPNDVLLTHNATVGRVGIVPHFEGKVVIGTSLTYYRLDSDVLLPSYFAQMFRSQEFQSQLENTMKQTTRNQVPITRQRDLLVPEPPRLPLQRQFAAIVHRFERLRAQQRESARQAEHLFQTLLHRAFAGEL